MQLSEAIRLGAMTHPQGFDHYEREGRTCALGAAANAAGVRRANCGEPCVSERWPFLNDVIAPCPACGDVIDVCELGGIITHLNDDHRWTREAIADWVSTVEPAVVAPALEMVAV